jgi:hypothetical protein
MHVVLNEPRGNASNAQLQDSLLGLSLAAAVPMWIPRAGQLTETERLARGRELAQFIAEHGDDVLYRGAKNGDSAKAFNAVAEALAIGACQPGGVTAFGQHWCTDHHQCELAASSCSTDELWQAFTGRVTLAAGEQHEARGL